MTRLAGKKALITGAAAGIGRAIALRFAAEGASLACVDVDETTLTRTLAELQRSGCTALGITADVGLADDVERAARQGLEALNGIDILVNNAGVNASGRVDTVTPDDWNRVLAVNLTSMFRFSRALWTAFARQRSGAIVNMSSIMALTGVRESVAYCTSKAAVIGFTRSVAADGAPLGIRVNCICPGYVSTPIMDRAHSKATQARISEQIPMKRMASPEEVAAACVFLASDEASYVTGSTLVLDGAATAGFAGCWLND